MALTQALEALGHVQDVEILPIGFRAQGLGSNATIYRQNIRILYAYRYNYYIGALMTTVGLKKSRSDP